MKAIIITEEEEPIQLVDVPVPTAQAGECIVKVSHSSLNRRDQWIREGMYPGIQYGTTLGSDGCGEVVEGSSGWLGKKVVINPNVGWGEDPEVQSSFYSVLGMPTNGTLAEYMKVPEHRIHERPAHLNDEEGAALPLAALTAFRATISKAKAGLGKRILITGAGGGVSQFAIDFALAVGSVVYVTSGSESKIARVIKKGVKAGFNYRDEKWVKQAAAVGGFDAIIDSAGGNQLNHYIKMIKPGGRIVMYGSTTGYPQNLDVFRLFWSQAQIMGSTMGNDDEFARMIEFVNEHKLKPTIDKVYPFQDYLKAFDRFKSPEASGKIVISW